jgi:RND family efflux transporter MFP subunit
MKISRAVDPGPRIRASLFFLSLFGAALLVLGCGISGGKPEASSAKGSEKSTVVRVELITAKTLTLNIELTGTVEAGKIAQLSSPAEGPVTDLYAREGDTVTRGQELLAIGRTEGATSLVDSLREDLSKEEDNLQRTRRLVDIGALPGEQLDWELANVTRIRAQLTKAQESIRDYIITAPWAGIVSKMRVREGDVVAPRTLLVEVYDPDSLIVRVSVPEQDAASLAKGMKGQVELDAYPKRSFSAGVARLYPYLDSRTHSRIIELALSETPLLLPGMFARVSLVRETLADAIAIPSNSILGVPGGGTAVFVAQNGKAARRKIQTGIEIDGRTIISSGLQIGDQLVVAGYETLKDGAALKVINNSAKEGERL